MSNGGCGSLARSLFAHSMLWRLYADSYSRIHFCAPRQAAGTHSPQMRLESYFALGWSTYQHLFSWLFLIAMVIKVGSTLLLLCHRHIRPLRQVGPRANAWWWVTKISALILCMSAGALCWLAGDEFGQRFFGFLLGAACIMVVVMLRRQKSMNSKPLGMKHAD